LFGLDLVVGWDRVERGVVDTAVNQQDYERATTLNAHTARKLLGTRRKDFVANAAAPKTPYGARLLGCRVDGQNKVPLPICLNPLIDVWPERIEPLTGEARSTEK